MIVAYAWWVKKFPPREGTVYWAMNAVYQVLTGARTVGKIEDENIRGKISQLTFIVEGLAYQLEKLRVNEELIIEAAGILLSFESVEDMQQDVLDVPVPAELASST